MCISQAPRKFVASSSAFGTTQTVDPTHMPNCVICRYLQRARVHPPGQITCDRPKYETQTRNFVELPEM